MGGTGLFGCLAVLSFFPWVFLLWGFELVAFVTELSIIR